MNKTGCMLQWTNNRLCAYSWSTAIEQSFIDFITEDMLKVCYSFHYQPPTYMQFSFLSQPSHTTTQYPTWFVIYRAAELGQYWTNALQEIRGKWTAEGQHYSTTSGYTWQGASEWSLSTGQMNKVVDQQKSEGSSLDKKMIPLTCPPLV
jgi:hypothetical protein